MDASVQDAVETKTKWSVGNVKITKVVELETVHELADAQRRS